MRAAVEAARGSGLCLLGVTVLTSMDEQDMIDAGYEYDPHTLVLRRAEQALAAGMGGIVCSASEAAAVRKIVGPELAVVTPGIRPAGAEHGDQKRVVTPARRHPQRGEPSGGGRGRSCRRPTGAPRRRPFLPEMAQGLRTTREEEKWRKDTGSRMSM